MKKKQQKVTWYEIVVDLEIILLMNYLRRQNEPEKTNNHTTCQFKEKRIT